jgi:hypothetical protein
MNSQDDKLESALLQLRAASNPRVGAKAHILTALQAPSSQPRATDELPVRREPVRRPTLSRGPMEMLKAARKPFAWSLALSLAMFAAGFGVGRGSAELHSPGGEPAVSDGSASQARVLDQPVAPEIPVEAPREARLVAEPSKSEVERPVLREPSARAALLERQPKRRARSAAALSKPAPSPLSLAEALQLLQRADRAIYSGDPAWAISLLDELDARAAGSLLREERVATRVLALCRDGQVDAAERLANAARNETPGSIYGALLDRACNPPQSGASSAAGVGSKSTTP